MSTTSSPRCAQADEDRIATIAALYSWTAQTAWGDLDAINIHWGRRDLRAGVQASQADCTRKRCRFYPHLCYLHGARRRAGSSHVVVTNHALLFRDVVAQGGILPPIRHWIVDEAHSVQVAEVGVEAATLARAVRLRCRDCGPDFSATPVKVDRVEIAPR